MNKIQISKINILLDIPNIKLKDMQSMNIQQSFVEQSIQEQDQHFINDQRQFFQKYSHQPQHIIESVQHSHIVNSQNQQSLINVAPSYNHSQIQQSERQKSQIEELSDKVFHEELKQVNINEFSRKNIIDANSQIIHTPVQNIQTGVIHRQAVNQINQVQQTLQNHQIQHIQSIQRIENHQPSAQSIEVNRSINQSQQNSIRHTISTGSTGPQYFVQQPAKNVLLRNSLPANQQVKQVMVNNQNFIQTQKLQVVQPAQQSLQTAKQTHQVRFPQHFPQSQIPPHHLQQINKISQQLIQSPSQQVAHFHQSNQQNIQINPTLQKSEIVYRTTITQNNINQRKSQNRMENRSKSLNHHSLSLENKKLPVTFNYNANQTQIQSAIIAQPVINRPASLSPANQEQVNLNTVRKTIPSNLNQYGQHSIQSNALLNVQHNVQHNVQRNAQQPSVQTIITAIQQIQQSPVMKRQSIHQKLQAEAPPGQSSKDLNHIQMKYKRLLYSYNKLTKENQLIKQSFEDKINIVVKRLENANKLLKEQNLSLHTKFQQSLNQQQSHYQQIIISLNHQISLLSKQSLKSSPPKPSKTLIQPSQLYELNNKVQQLSSQSSVLEVQLSKYYLKSIIMQSQIQRLNQKITKKDSQFNLLKSLSLSFSQENRDSQELQSKFHQIQHSLYQLSKRNQTLQEEIRNRDNEQFFNVRQSHLELINQAQNQIQRLQQQTILLNQKNKQYIKKIKQLQLQPIKESTFNESNHLNPLQSQYQFTISSLRSQIVRKDNQLQRQSKLYQKRNNDLLDQLKISYQQRQLIRNKLEQQIQILKNQKEQQNNIIRDVKEQNFQLQYFKKNQQYQQLNKISYNNFTTISDNQDANRFKQELDNLRIHKQRQIKQNQRQIQSLDQQLMQLAKDNSRMKKQIAQISINSSTIQSTTQILNKRNQQIIQLNKTLFQKQRLLIQSNNTYREYQRLCIQNQHLLSQNQTHIKSYQQHIKKYKQLQQNLNVQINHYKNLQNQYQMCLNAIDKKDHQIIKLRQNHQLLITNVQELEKQLDKLRTTNKRLQTQFAQQRNRFNQDITRLNSKLHQYDRIARQHSTFKYTISQLQSQVEKYIYQQKQSQQLSIKQKSRIKTLQSQLQDIISQQTLLTQKSSQTQRKLYQSSKKHKKAIQQLHSQIKSLQQTKVKQQKQRIIQLESQIKQKDNKIWKLQKHVEQIEERLDQIGELQGQTERDTLKQKLRQYQARLFNHTIKATNSSFDYQATKVFQNQVIYQLQQENQRLKSLLTQKKIIKPTNDQTVSKSQSRLQQVHQQELDQVQNRLQNFNLKLQGLIKTGSYQNIQLKEIKSKASGISSEIKRGPNRIVPQMQAFQSTTQLKQLKLQYLQLQQYCHKIQSELLSNTSIVNSNTNVSHNQSMQTYYKDKNVELEDRVESLINVNTTLKHNLQLLMQRKNQTNTIITAQELEQTKTKNVALQTRIKILIIQNQKFKQTLNSHIKQKQEALAKVFQLQQKLFQLKRLSNQSLLSKSSYQRDITLLKSQLLQKQSHLTNLLSQLSSYQSQQSFNISQLKQQLNKSQLQITKLQNRNKIEESQIQRLNQIIKKKQNQYNQELNKQKNKITNLQNEINRLNQQHDNKQQDHNGLRFQITRITQELKAAQFQYQQLKKINQNLARKLQQTEFKLREIQQQNNNLENELQLTRQNQNQWNLRAQQYQIDITKLKNQIGILQSQIQRVTQNSQAKQRNLQNQIQGLKSKLGFTQMDQISLRSKTSSWESEKQSYEGEIIKLKNQLAFLHLEIQRISNQYQKKERNLEARILNLQNTLSQIQSNSFLLQQNSQAWNISKQRYQSQIIELKNKSLLLQSQINRLIQLVHQKQSLNISLKSSPSSWSTQKSTYQQQITRLTSSNHFLHQQIQRLSLKITSLEKQQSQSYLNANSEVMKLRRQLNDNQELLGNYQLKLQLLQRLIHNFVYFTEIHRSLYLEIQALLDERHFLTQQQYPNLYGNVARSIQKGLKCVADMNQLLPNNY